MPVACESHERIEALELRIANMQDDLDMTNYHTEVSKLRSDLEIAEALLTVKSDEDCP